MGIANSFGTTVDGSIQRDFNTTRIRSPLAYDRLSLPGNPLDFRPELLEAFLPHQFLGLAAGAEIRMQFLRDQSAQCVEAILTAGMPVAFRFQKLLGSQSPRLPLLALGDHRLASVLEPLDPGSQRVTFLLQFIDPPGLVSGDARALIIFGSLAAIGFRRGR